LRSSPPAQTFKPLKKRKAPLLKTFWRRFCCGPRFRHPSIPIKREETMINSEKHTLLHDYYQTHILLY